jgi:hypothetical protein
MQTSYVDGDSCPISGRKVNAKTARINGLIVTALLVVALFTPFRWVLAILAADFFIKVVFGLRPSPFCWLSRTLAGALHLQPRPVDEAPKRFAAGLGLVFSTGGLVLGPLLSQWPAYYVVVGVFTACAALEGFAGICVGCEIYQTVARRRRQAGLART